MIDIKFDGGYRIYNQDELSVILSCTCTVTNPKSKNYGQEREKVIGYYANLHQAINAYSNRLMMDGQHDISGGVDKIVKELERIRKEVDLAIETCC